MNFFRPSHLYTSLPFVSLVDNPTIPVEDLQVFVIQSTLLERLNCQKNLHKIYHSFDTHCNFYDKEGEIIGM